MIALHGKTEHQLDAYVDDLRLAAEVIIPETTTAVVTSDPDDDHVVALAVSGKAQVLRTLDRHLHTVLCGRTAISSV